ncbi:site-specific DNA-methyltransferase [Staphylococcus hominis]|uniref:Site-specific DNA-methyltransferase n=1 Tax=Staphylococcus hominis TaxID=1290 RepID=A0A974QNR9_STAHO|nr:site-specific DNA-methyltransferase [Staphylococcus hominis]PTK31162.1 site-specific DNA-methyltransferase [Staphylococcus hominis]
MKLELQWLHKNKKENIEPRIIIHDKEKSYGDKNTGNKLIFGDNLLALKALEAEYTGKIKAIYIDPPYNTKNAFDHYDDNKEHSIWLELMYQRLKVLQKLLAEDGTIWISIDNQECHYLKVICDEIFGRNSFISDITYERSGSAGLGQSGSFVNTSEHILVYGKNEKKLNNVLGQTPLPLKTKKRYNKVLVSEGEKKLIKEFPSKSNKLPVKIFKHSNFSIETISLKKPEERSEEINEEYINKYQRIFRTNNVQKENAFQNSLINEMEKTSLYTVEYTPSRGKYKDQLITLYYYNAELFSWLKDTSFIENDVIFKTNKLTSVWKHEEIPKADLAKEGNVEFSRSKKPEQLIKRILELSTNEGDLILDSFLGSGTTAAVAHKMNRKWIGIELGEHALTLCKPRLDRVIDNKDKSGITKSVNWNGGGGYDFYSLAPSLIKEDELGERVINKDLTDEQLSRTIALHEGFSLIKEDNYYWKQFKGTEHSYLYVLNDYVSEELLNDIQNSMQKDEFLLLVCRSFDNHIINKFNNIKIKKIDSYRLENYDYAQENYKLNIVEYRDEVDDFE